MNHPMDDATWKRTCDAVREAGAIIKEAWDRPRTVSKKGRIDLLTETDPAVEAALMASLPGILPGAAIMAEETAADTPLGGGNGYTWVIDPLDGTTNFVHGLPFVAVSVGLWEGGQAHQGGRPLAGFVYNPILEEFFCARRGRGATVNGRALGVSATERLEDAMVATGFPYAVRDELADILARLERVLFATRGLRRYGAASLDLAYVAWGKLDAFFETGLKPWDTCAGWCLVEEAGGAVSRFDGQAYDLYAHDILATNGRVHAAVSKLLAGGSAS